MVDNRDLCSAIQKGNHVPSFGSLFDGDIDEKIF